MTNALSKMGFLALLLVVLAAGCKSKNSDDDDGGGSGNGNGSSNGHEGPLNVPLGTSANYVILAETGIINTVPGAVVLVTGDMGISPSGSAAITGFSPLTLDGSGQFSTSTQVNGRIYASDYLPPTPATLTTAVSNMVAAYTDAASRDADEENLNGGNLGGEVLDPGVYRWTSAVTIPTSITLSGAADDVWIFQISGDLTMAASTTVFLTGGARASNVYWQVAGDGGVNIGSGARFEGTILARRSITLASSSTTVNGRLLSQTVVTIAGSVVTRAQAGPLIVDLGTAGTFAILAKSGIDTVPPSSVTGDLGVSPIGSTALTGWSETVHISGQYSTSSQVPAPGKLYAANYMDPTPSKMTTAISDMETAFTAAAGLAADVTELGAGNIGGMTLAPGVYKWGTSVTVPTNLTLSGGANDVWVFQIAGDLTIASAQSVILIGGAQAKNIFWQVEGGAGAKLDTGAHLEGTIMTQTAINLLAGASVNGRLLAQTAVNIKSSTVVQPAP